MAFLAISGFIVVVYLPVAAIATLGILALWNKLHPPKLWQVLVATAFIVVLPWVVTDPAGNKGLWHNLGSGIISALPVVIPAVLWVLQRRGSDGEFSPLAKRAGSLLVAYIVLVVLVIPALAVGYALLSGLAD
ncbi:MAG: hypothetical protein QNJ23_10015 [Woeseiaceae bacterium]|nr:hypothetical protein [Woeseiaceae bacterium]